MNKKTTKSAVELLKGLTCKQRKYVEAYISNGQNSTHAAEAAGYSGSSNDSLRAQGSRLFRDVNVKATIDACLTEIMGEELVDLKARVLNELKLIGFSDIKDILDESGYIDLTKIEHVETRAIKAITNKKKYLDKDKTIIDSETKVIYHDKIKSIELMCKYLGILTDNINHSGGIDIKIKFE